jgi:nicotinamide-nucleotide amidase
VLYNLIDENLLEKISKTLKEKKLTIATAESATGGLIANILTNISGSSKYFDRGLITYSNRAKMELLNVKKETLDKYGAVSKEIAKEMAEGVMKKSDVDIGVSTTGIAGPSGGTKEKPVGTVFIGFSNKKETIVDKYQFDDDRLENKENFCNAALDLIYENIR